jgi:hypothetical protein
MCGGIKKTKRVRERERDCESCDHLVYVNLK